EGVGWAALRAAASRVDMLTACAAQLLCRSAQTRVAIFCEDRRGFDGWLFYSGGGGMGGAPRRRVAGRHADRMRRSAPLPLGSNPRSRSSSKIAVGSTGGSSIYGGGGIQLRCASGASSLLS